MVREAAPALARNPLGTPIRDEEPSEAEGSATLTASCGRKEQEKTLKFPWL